VGPSTTAAAEVALQGVGPGPPRHQFPAVEEDGKATLLERAGDALHHHMVEGVVAEEDVEFSSRVHPLSLASLVAERSLARRRISRAAKARRTGREPPGGKPPGPPKGKRTEHKGLQVLGEAETDGAAASVGALRVAGGRAEGTG
jgi:hypothetical protein